MRPGPRRAILSALTAGAVLATVLLASTAASAYPGAPWFEPGKVYTENFPDPHVVVDGNRFVAYGTATGGAYLPAMTSTDLATWVARPAYDPGKPHNSDPYFNDALPEPASWGADRQVSGRMTKEVWAPGVARVGGQWLAFYTIRVMDGTPGRFCISVATSSSPLGPFVDRTTEPLQCDADQAGSIDPSPFVDAGGTPYLLWKSEGVPGKQPTRLWSRQLRSDGLGFATGSSPTELLRTSLSWEGSVIENPSLVRHGGRYLLFYSANEHRSADYAAGWAECASPIGPCSKRSVASPLLASHGSKLGPGGASAFETPDGRLWLAYHWWNAPYTDYPPYPECTTNGTCTTQGQRRMSVEPVTVHPDGSLQVGDAPPSLGAPAVAVAGSPGGGYWVSAANGAVAAFGPAYFAGSAAGIPLAHPIVGMAPTRSGSGYWLIARDGGIFAFNAPFRGSTGDTRLNQPVVGMAVAPGDGYWSVAADGGIFAFSAPFHGSTGNIALNQPIVGMAPTPTGNGYWLVARDGGIFAFGDAGFHGSTGHLRLASPITGMAASPSGGGYWMVGGDGGIFAFGDARYQGRPQP